MFYKSVTVSLLQQVAVELLRQVTQGGIRHGGNSNSLLIFGSFHQVDDTQEVPLT